MLGSINNFGIEVTESFKLEKGASYGLVILKHGEYAPNAEDGPEPGGYEASIEPTDWIIVVDEDVLGNHKDGGDVEGSTTLYVPGFNVGSVVEAVLDGNGVYVSAATNVAATLECLPLACKGSVDVTWSGGQPGDDQEW